VTLREALSISDLGLIDYEEALDLQRSLREARLDGRAPDTLLLLEHPPTITLGRRSRPEDLLVSQEQLESQGVHVAEIERGGKITYHGPGQLVAYPILGLRELDLSVPRYVSTLEQAMIDWLATLGIEATRRKGFPGVWVNGRKIGAVGVHLKRWVSIHGIALNVNPDLGAFQAIVPCGIDGVEVTSVAAELGGSWSVADAKVAVAESLRAGLGYARLDWRAGSAVVPTG
jgi:lipoate-protein ligase B